MLDLSFKRKLLRKGSPILNSELIAQICRLGHGQTMVIADAGLPVPASARLLDLSLIEGVPSFFDVVRAVASELVVERIEIAEELKVAGDIAVEQILDSFDDEVEVRLVPHEDLKDRLGGADVVVRTGECTPYANLVLHAGVSF